MNHTPGPWEYDAAEVRAADGTIVVDAWDGVQKEADGILIASAPELLQVAIGCLGYFEYMRKQGSEFTPDEQWLTPLRVVINKALGKEAI